MCTQSMSMRQQCGTARARTRTRPLYPYIPEAIESVSCTFSLLQCAVQLHWCSAPNNKPFFLAWVGVEGRGGAAAVRSFPPAGDLDLGGMGMGMWDGSVPYPHIPTSPSPPNRGRPQGGRNGRPLRLPFPRSWGKGGGSGNAERRAVISPYSIPLGEERGNLRAQIAPCPGRLAAVLLASWYYYVASTYAY